MLKSSERVSKAFERIAAGSKQGDPVSARTTKQFLNISQKSKNCCSVFSDAPF